MGQAAVLSNLLIERRPSRIAIIMWPNERIILQNKVLRQIVNRSNLSKTSSFTGNISNECQFEFGVTVNNLPLVIHQYIESSMLFNCEPEQWNNIQSWCHRWRCRPSYTKDSAWVLIYKLRNISFAKSKKKIGFNL